MKTRDCLERLLDTAPPLGSWVRYAACADPDVGVADVYTSEAPAVHEVALAKSVCSRCPVRQDCADYAAHTPVYGLWGGRWRGRTAKDPWAA